MKKYWEKLSILSRYYLVSMIVFFICWSILWLIKVEYIDNLFFTTSFVWHFTLLTPGLKEKMLIQKQRFSFISVVVRVNYYLQLFIKIDKYAFGPSIIRAISPLVFTCLLLIVGGSGNIFFTLLGSFCFEIVHFLLNKKVTSVQINDIETPTTFQNAENSHE